MSLFTRCIETYDAMEHLVGVTAEDRHILAPIAHIITSAKIEITVDEKGNFIRATNIDKKIPIPCTESSAARTSSPDSHPLCDQIGYVDPIEAKKKDLFFDALKEWDESGYSCEKIHAVLLYVGKKTVRQDLIDAKVEIKSEKDLIIWNVEGLGENSGSVCEDRDLQKKYVDYYASKLETEADYCFVTGEMDKPAASHLKGVMSLNGNAKLISANDKEGFTYRGKFIDDTEPSRVGYIASQKAHNALKWVISNEGAIIGERAYVCWNPKGKSIPRFDLPLIDAFEDEKPEPTQYKDLVFKKILGHKSKLQTDDAVVIAVFDAATSGRLAVTYYNDMMALDFLDRLEYWDTTACFPSSFHGTYAPKLYDFVNFAYGTYRGEKFETDPKVMRQHMQRMLICRIDRGVFPVDIMKKLVINASNLQLYNNTTRERIIHVTCAAICKYHKDRYKEEYSMALDKDYKDRSYQYGRLLAILEKIEKDTYSPEESRETNAIRNQQLFVQRPQTAFTSIIEKLKQGYYSKLSEGAKVYYENMIEEILDTISELGMESINKPLSENYIIGYYLQKQALYQKNK